MGGSISVPAGTHDRQSNDRHTPYPLDPHETVPLCRTCTDKFGVDMKWRESCEGGDRG